MALDSVVAKGLRRVALPFALTASAVTDGLQRLVPPTLVAVRLWTAATVAFATSMAGSVWSAVVVILSVLLRSAGRAGSARSPFCSCRSPPAA